jgi:hypothetical protein
MAYNCIANSSLAQSKLFLRPSDREDEVWWYRELRSKINTGGVRPIIDQCFEPSTEGPREQNVTRMIAVALCPLLRLRYFTEATALDRIKKRGVQDYDLASPVGVPAENSKYGNMFLTDPPTHSVFAQSKYRHNLRPSMTISATRRVVSNTSHGLTFNEAIRSGREQLGHILSCFSSEEAIDYRVTSIDDEIRGMIQKYGGHFVLDPRSSKIRFPYRIVVPTAGEWLEMDVKRVREKERLDALGNDNMSNTVMR